MGITSGVKDVTTSGFASFAVMQDGSLWAAGRNNYGQLGDKTKTDRHIFVKIVDEGVKEASNGDSHRRSTPWPTRSNSRLRPISRLTRLNLGGAKRRQRGIISAPEKEKVLKIPSRNFFLL